MNTNGTTNPTVTPHERRAAALAEIETMQHDLDAARVEIDQLKADLHQADDRMVLLMDERLRLRGEANVYRTSLIELATAMGNINLLTGRAVDIMLKANELLAKAAPVEDVPPKRSAVDLDAVTNALKEIGGTHK